MRNGTDLRRLPQVLNFTFFGVDFHFLVLNFTYLLMNFTLKNLKKPLNFTAESVLKVKSNGKKSEVQRVQC